MMISRSFTEISRLARPAPGETWTAARARWYLVKTDFHEEKRVARLIADLDDPPQVFLPMAIKDKKIVRGKEYPDVPLLPCRLFVQTALDGWTRIRNLKFVTGFVCDPEGFPKPIPDEQMHTFRRVLGEAHAEAEKRAALGKALGRGAKAKRKYMPASEALDVIKAQMEEKG